MALNANKVPQGNAQNRVQQDEIDVGNYPSRLVQVLDMGRRPKEEWDESTHSYKPSGPILPHIMLTYELTTEFMKDADGNDVEDKPRWLSEEWPLYNLNSEKATTTKRYLAFDPRKQDEGDWVKQVAKPCTLTVVHTNKGRAKIGGVTPPMKGFNVPELKNPPKIFDLDAPDMEIFGSLPQWVQDKIKANVDFIGSPLEAALNGAPAKKPEPAKPAKAAKPAPQPEPEDVEGDDEPW